MSNGKVLNGTIDKEKKIQLIAQNTRILHKRKVTETIKSSSWKRFLERFIPQGRTGNEDEKVIRCLFHCTALNVSHKTSLQSSMIQ
jgi:hypothetical protein